MHPSKQRFRIEIRVIDQTEWLQFTEDCRLLNQAEADKAIHRLKVRFPQYEARKVALKESER